ncbi:MAG: hypothetical protein IH969_07590 [Candidatus Krumholzibacteriota bacterium]|nr:hypothetical protein [Candidatus Krumholzibacteriota bacterium]
MIESAAYFHPFFVHFPVALIVAAALAEVLHVARRNSAFGSAARFMIIVAAWVSLPTALSGFAAGSVEVLSADQERAFAIHRIAGMATPCLIFLCAGLAMSARRTGQIWELMLYRVFLAAAVVTVTIAGIKGGEIVHGPI